MRPHSRSAPSRALKVVSPSPQPDQPDAYTDALERLNASIAFGSAEENQRDTVRIRSCLSPLLLSHTLVVRRGWSKREPRSSPNCPPNSLLRACQAVIPPVPTSNTPHSLVMISRPCYISSSSSALFLCQRHTHPILPPPPSCRLPCQLS